MDDKLVEQMEGLVLDSVPDQREESKEEDTAEPEEEGRQHPLTHVELKALSQFQKIKNIRYGPKASTAPKKRVQEFRRIPVPRHRRSQLKEHWESIVNTLIKHMKLQVRMNTRKGCVEMRTCKETQDVGAIQKSADFLKAFMLGFELKDAIALLRLEDLYVDSFQVKDVKTLHGDNLSRCIGRICGEKGKTKFAIENSTRTRIVLAGSRVHILGSFSNIKYARDAVCNLILGSPAGKVYSQLRSVTRRMKEF